MSTTNVDIDDNAGLLDAIQSLCADHREITLISLCTLDGFSIKSFATKEMGMEADKVAAIASSLCAISNSSSIQFTEEEFDITIIESKGGNTLFCRTNYRGTDCVVTISARTKLSLAQARFVLRRFSDVVADLP